MKLVTWNSSNLCYAIVKSEVILNLFLRKNSSLEVRTYRIYSQVSYLTYYSGISLANGNIAYSTFFMVIVRTNMDDMCFYLEAGRLIGWVYNRQHSNSAIVMGCTRMMEQFKAIVANDAKIQKFENISTAGAAGDAASTTRQLQKRTVKPARGNNIRGFQKFYDRKSDRKKSSSASSLTVQERIHTQPCTRLLPATRGKSTVVVPSTSVDGEFRQFSCPMNYGFSEWYGCILY